MIRHGVPLLVIVGKAPFADLAISFVATRRRIEVFVDRATLPVIAKLHRPTPAQLALDPHAPGRIEQWYPPR